MDLLYFPFDDQTCRIQFLHTVRLRIVREGNLIVEEGISYYTGSASVSKDFLLNNEQWDLLDITMNNASVTTSSFAPDTVITYPAFEIVLHLQRKPSFYFVVLVIPGTVIAVICVMGFLLPSESGEKVSLQLTAFLSLMVLILVVVDIVPPIGGRFPLIGNTSVMHTKLFPNSLPHVWEGVPYLPESTVGIPYLCWSGVEIGIGICSLVRVRVSELSFLIGPSCSILLG